MSFIDKIKPNSDAEPMSNSERMDAVLEAIYRMQAMAQVIESAFHDEIVDEHVNLSGNDPLLRACNKFSKLCDIMFDELTNAQRFVEANYASLAFTAPQGKNTLPQWRAAVDYWRNLETAPIKANASEEESAAACDAAANALDALVETRAPNLAVLVEKMRIIRETSTEASERYFRELMHDVEALA